MSNLETAKEKLAENQAFTAIISPPAGIKKNKIHFLPKKTIDMIEEVLYKKLETKQEKIEESIESAAVKKYENELNAIHHEAITLKKKIIQLNEEIRKKENNEITLADKDNDFKGYFNALPASINETKNMELLQFPNMPRYESWNRSINSNWLPQLIPFKENIEKFLLNLKIGVQPASDAQTLLDEIEKNIK